MFNYKNYLFSVLVLSFGVLNTNLVAQDESADDVEEVIVTGTRLKADGFEAVSPVSVVTADNIKRTGQTRIEDVLNQMPQIETANSSFEPSGETGKLGSGPIRKNSPMKKGGATATAGSKKGGAPKLLKK